MSMALASAAEVGTRCACAAAPEIPTRCPLRVRISSHGASSRTMPLRVCIDANGTVGGGLWGRR